MSAQPAKAGGHGDHWGCVFRAVEEGILLDAIREVVARDPRPLRFAGGVAYYSSGDYVRVCVLAVDGNLVSAYPQVVDGPVWPVRIREVVPWANGLEGQIMGDCFGASFGFFDTRYFANRRRYKPGETYDFHMGALAYRIEPAADLEAESDIGANISFKGACAYMPATLGNEQADVDDLWFRSPLDGEVEATDLAGRQLRTYPVTIAIPEHFEMNVALYAADHALSEGMHNVRRGDDIEGFLWLQGYLRES